MFQHIFMIQTTNLRDLNKRFLTIFKHIKLLLTYKIDAFMLLYKIKGNLNQRNYLSSLKQAKVNV
jgi:hypothetical protein